MSFKKKLLLPIITMIVTGGCKNSFDAPQVSAGNADFTHFVALGGFFTAGFGDGALHYELQKNSFPAILASKFELVGGGLFKQPMVNPGAGLYYDINFTLASKLSLTIENDCKGKQALVTSRSSGDVSNETWIGMQGPYNNLGVPGAKCFNLAQNTFGRSLPLGNPYYHRFAFDNVTSSTILDEVAKVNPTFFVLWVGNEDVWQYAKSGGVGNLNSFGVNDITPVDTFLSAYKGILNKLFAGNISKGAIANIPDINCFPFFTEIPYNGLQLTTTQADSLNSISTGFVFHPGANAFVVYPPNSSTPKQLGQGEYVLLSVPKDSINCAGWGMPQHPIPDYYILDSNEVNNVQSYTAQYNTIINLSAIQNNLAFVDMQSFFRKYKSAQLFNGVSNTSQFLRNSIFSYDGIYTNSRGNACIANEFINAINEKYSSTLPGVDVNAFRGNVLP